MGSNLSVGSDRVTRVVDGFSLEMTGRDIPGLAQAVRLIPPGTRVNVTFLGNEDLELRVAAVQAVKDADLIPVPHLSARRLKSQSQLEEYLARLQDVGATERVFAVGGDPATPDGPYDSAWDVIRSGVLERYGVKEVGISGYPEGHPDISNDVLWEHLMKKTSSLAEQGMDTVILTQFGFDTEPIIKWISEVRTAGVDAPIRVGVPGPAGVKRLLGFARRFGVSANAMIVKKYGFSLTNLMGTAGPEKFITDLAAHVESVDGLGQVNLHFYTFGGLDTTAGWIQKYQDRVRG